MIDFGNEGGQQLGDVIQRKKKISWGYLRPALCVLCVDFGVCDENSDTDSYNKSTFGTCPYFERDKERQIIVINDGFLESAKDR